jgi:hypothetical protein
LSGCISILNRRFYVPLEFQEYFKADATSHFLIPARAGMTAEVKQSNLTGKTLLTRYGTVAWALPTKAV